MRVYLAGSIDRPWGEWLGKAISDNYPGLYQAVLARIDFTDPSSHSLEREEEYTAWGLLGVRECDVLLAFMDEENPAGGYGLCVEIGYARALGKTIVFVDRTHERYYCFGMARQVSDVVVSSLDEAARFIVKLVYL